MEADLSNVSESSCASIPFSHLNASLVSKGYLTAPLSVSNLPIPELEKLSNVLHSLLLQREEDLSVRSSLSAANRTLVNKLERSEKYLASQKAATIDAQRKEETAKSKINSVTAALQAERLSARQTLEALAKARRDLVVVRVAATQARVASERASERVRARLAESTTGSLRAALPSVFVLDEVAESLSDGGSLRSSDSMRSGDQMMLDQISDLEEKRRRLEDANQAMRRLTTDAINAVSEAVSALAEACSEEEKLATASDNSAGQKLKAPSLAPAHRHGSTASATYYQRGLFPPDLPLLTSHGVSSTSAHPATRALGAVMSGLAAEASELRRLREARTWRLRDAHRQAKDEERDRVWKEKCEREERDHLDLHSGHGWIPHAGLLENAQHQQHASLVHPPAETVSTMRTQISTLTHSVEALQSDLEERNAALDASRRAEIEARSLVEVYLQRAEETARMMPTEDSHATSQSAEPSVVKDSSATQAVTQEDKQAVRIEAEAARQQYVELARTLEAERDTLRRERLAIQSDRERLASEHEKITGERERISGERKSLQDELDSLAVCLKEARMQGSSSPARERRKKAPRRTLAAQSTDDDQAENHYDTERVRIPSQGRSALSARAVPEAVLDEHLLEADTSAGNIARGAQLSGSSSNREGDLRTNLLPPLQINPDEEAKKKRQRLEQAIDAGPMKRRVGTQPGHSSATVWTKATTSRRARTATTSSSSASRVRPQASAAAVRPSRPSAKSAQPPRPAVPSLRTTAAPTRKTSSSSTVPSIASPKRPLGENAAMCKSDGVAPAAIPSRIKPSATGLAANKRLDRRTQLSARSDGIRR